MFSAQNTDTVIQITNNGIIRSDINSLVSITNRASNSSVIFNNNGGITGYVNLDKSENNILALTMNNNENGIFVILPILVVL